MPIQVKNELGSIHVSDQIMSTLAGSAAVECYGLVGMASRNQLKDGFAEMLGRENLSRGVVVRREQDLLHIDLYIIVSYGTKISEVAHNVQNRVKYMLNEVVGLEVDFVNIFVQGVRVAK
ncbi:Asp23/Gls24 family envelope stress response protein [Paenibacillus contaminans]|jgi:uncharacterized alkaline shock family protein YloU|uniref:Asp23/Gls24 family envelope stress response protein n=1 Tax=Paenibacillus contaminans TaxID=450362 RepID=A0A329MJC9_9BACL|nr:Asp23/Gls24 family envelope stress response protein [Paenibacillus contaminans]RAV19959.1 Asp23/Gls24 family envelope stress response protein [Paenibacillus contaminans]